ncbi:cytochrome P450 2U1-like [Antedon mediterranea]|uniref:cytochrome P450 2U1-like n=1 Tax=Antedon mediterranea TaxID=105859 RepID=UPI003AF7D04A
MLLLNTSEIFNVLIIVLTTLLMVHVYMFLNSKLPPGPIPIPLLGNMLALRVRPFKTIGRWAKYYGDILTVYNGPMKKVVWINEVTLGIETFVKRANVFSVRKLIPVICYLSGKKGSVAFENGPEWKKGRKWMLSVLRQFGVGKTSLEDQIIVEADALCEAISQYQSQPFDPNHFISCAAANVICSMSFNRRYDYKDLEFLQLLSDLQAYVKQMNMSNLETHLPCLTDLPFFKHKKRPSEGVIQFVKNHIHEHLSTIDRDNVRDILDSLIVEVEKNEEDAPFTFETMYTTVITLFVAGSETTSSTMLWFILFMASFPEEQEKVYNELHSEFGSEGQPTTAALSNLPLFVATIYEVQRLGSVAPSLLPRGSSEDCEVKGFKLPKGININLNIYQVHMDPNHWDNPTEFKPSRFFDQDGKKVIRPKSFMPFGLGRRICIGENMAKMELLIILSKLLLRFKLTVPNGQTKPEFEPNVGFTLSPKSFKISAIPRI